MRKTLYLLTVLMAVLVSACTTEEIPIKHDITFKVNPRTVISPFDSIKQTLFSFDFGSKEYQLRFRMLVYNSDNILVAEDSLFWSDYVFKHNFDVRLEDGEYTAVFSSDVVMKDKSLEYWHLLGTDRLSTLTFKDAGKIGVNRKILGLAVKHFSVGDVKEISVDLKPAGALLIVRYQNWNSYDNVDGFKLASNRFSDEMTLNDIGEPTYSIQSSERFAWSVSSVSYSKDTSSRYTGGYQYVFLFPMKNVTFQFAWTDNNTGTNYLFEGAKKLMNIQAGHAYDFSYDCETRKAEWLDVTDDTVL